MRLIRRLALAALGALGLRIGVCVRRAPAIELRRTPELDALDFVRTLTERDHAALPELNAFGSWDDGRRVFIVVVDAHRPVRVANEPGALHRLEVHLAELIRASRAKAGPGSWDARRGVSS